MKDRDLNVYVGVSLQGKWLTQEDFRQIVKLASDHFGFRRLVFLVADEIEMINQRVFSKGHERSLADRVEEQACRVEREITLACAQGGMKSGQISLRRWVEILDSRYWETFFEIRRIFHDNDVFRQDVKYAIQEYARRRRERSTDAQLLYLCNYVLHELPTLLQGITIEQKHYNSMIYPAPRNASIDRICQNIIDEKYGMTFFEPPFCRICRYEVARETE